ncbi:MAG: hypothetical protein RLZZ591_736 [Pseudomonadota bacterium]|jgi:GT2 family glycosyltransferase
MNKFKIVVATRESTELFFKNTATGRSLALYNSPLVDLQLFEKNNAGLSHLYNMVIDESVGSSDVIIFMHDDIHIIDYYWLDKVAAGLEVFDVVGLAGNRGRQPFQPSWLFKNMNFECDHQSNLSGIVGHGTCFPPEKLSIYGAPCQPVKILDGLFLACKSEKLHLTGTRFDEKFRFHAYDLDFCRSAEKNGMTLGTWDIPVIHESQGGYDAGWKLEIDKYFEKWGN